MIRNVRMVAKGMRNLARKASTFKKIKDDPLGFFTDAIVTILVKMFIPVPLVEDILLQAKGPILAIIASLMVIVIGVVMVFLTVIIIPIATPAGFIEKIVTLITGSNPDVTGEFAETSIPSRNPLGGPGLAFTTVTTEFMDPTYFLAWGVPHTGIDLVPNANYYTNSEAFKQSGKVLVFATHKGKATYFVDQFGGKTVEDVNDSGSLKTVYIHMSQVYVSTGQNLTAGTPIGVMGSTGRSTGPHVHYEIRVKNSSGWTLVNPRNYIQ